MCLALSPADITAARPAGAVGGESAVKALQIRGLYRVPGTWGAGSWDRPAVTPLCARVKPSAARPAARRGFGLERQDILVGMGMEPATEGLRGVFSTLRSLHFIEEGIPSDGGAQRPATQPPGSSELRRGRRASDRGSGLELRPSTSISTVSLFERRLAYEPTTVAWRREARFTAAAPAAPRAPRPTPRAQRTAGRPLAR